MALMCWKRGKAAQGISAAAAGGQLLGKGIKESGEAKGRTEDFAERGRLVVQGVLEDARLGQEVGDRLAQWPDIDRLFVSSE